MTLTARQLIRTAAVAAVSDAIGEAWEVVGTNPRVVRPGSAQVVITGEEVTERGISARSGEVRRAALDVVLRQTGAEAFDDLDAAADEVEAWMSVRKGPIGDLVRNQKFPLMQIDYVGMELEQDSESDERVVTMTVSFELLYFREEPER